MSDVPKPGETVSTPTPSVSTKPAATGTIHDLGYKRYVGTRRPPSTRWRVIMRHQISTGWKKWWRYKLALGMAVITMFIAGGLIFIFSDKTIRSFGPGAGDFMLTMADGVVPLSISHFFRAAFVLSLTLGATIIASDTQSGAFTFYFVRSVRPVDYVLGKLIGYGFLVATLVVIGPLLVACFRLGLSDNVDQLIDNLVILPKVLLICGLATLVFTALPLAMSSIVANRRYALALWAAYYLFVTPIAAALDFPALDLQTALSAITLEMFDIRILRGSALGISMNTAIVALLLQAAAAIAIIWYQVSRDQKTGVGGSS